MENQPQNENQNNNPALVIIAASPIGTLQSTDFIPKTIASNAHIVFLKDGNVAITDPNGTVSIKAPLEKVVTKKVTMNGRLDVRINDVDYFFRVESPSTIGSLVAFVDYLGRAGQTGNQNEDANSITNGTVAAARFNRSWFKLWGFMTAFFTIISVFGALLAIPTRYSDRGYLGVIIFGVFAIGFLWATIALFKARSRS